MVFIAHLHWSSLDKCYYVYLILLGLLGKPTINVGVSTTKVKAAIFLVLWQVASPLHTDHSGTLTWHWHHS